MAKVLTDSITDRKNILNNPYAIQHIQEQIGLVVNQFEGKSILLSREVAEFFEVDEKTIDRYISQFKEELSSNGYEVLIGARLRKLREVFVRDINVPNKARRVGIFDFRAFLNMAMLLVESDRARVLRSLILNIVIDVVSSKVGGSTKYINQRDEAYLISLYVGENYRQDFINALKLYVQMGNFKYPIYTNKIYKSIFKEHAGEYRAILNLKKEEDVRNTMYSEVLTTISMYETGLAYEMKKLSVNLNRKLTTKELDDLFEDFENTPTWKPQIEMVRMKMASRDYGLRSVTHPELINYINPLDNSEFERFLGEKSKELAERIVEYQEVFKRLKDK